MSGVSSRRLMTGSGEMCTRACCLGRWHCAMCLALEVDFETRGVFSFSPSFERSFCSSWLNSSAAPGSLFSYLESSPQEGALVTFSPQRFSRSGLLNGTPSRSLGLGSRTFSFSRNDLPPSPSPCSRASQEGGTPPPTRFGFDEQVRQHTIKPVLVNLHIQEVLVLYGKTPALPSRAVGIRRAR